MCTTPITTCALCVYNLWFMQTQIHCTLFLDCCAFSWNVCVCGCKLISSRFYCVRLSFRVASCGHPIIGRNTKKPPHWQDAGNEIAHTHSAHRLSLLFMEWNAERHRHNNGNVDSTVFFLLVVNLPLPIEDTVWHWRCHHCQKKKVAGDFYWLIGINYLTKWEWWYFGWIMWVSRATFVSLLSWMSAETDTALLNQSNCVAVSESEGERKREASVPFTLKKPLIIIE